MAVSNNLISSSLVSPPLPCVPCVPWETFFACLLLLLPFRVFGGRPLSFVSCKLITEAVWKR